METLKNNSNEEKVTFLKILKMYILMLSFILLLIFLVVIILLGLFVAFCGGGAYLFK